MAPLSGILFSWLFYNLLMSSWRAQTPLFDMCDLASDAGTCFYMQAIRASSIPFVFDSFAEPEVLFTTRLEEVQESETWTYIT